MTPILICNAKGELVFDHLAAINKFSAKSKFFKNQLLKG